MSEMGVSFSEKKMNIIIGCIAVYAFHKRDGMIIKIPFTISYIFIKEAIVFKPIKFAHS